MSLTPDQPLAQTADGFHEVWVRLTDHIADTANAYIQRTGHPDNVPLDMSLVAALPLTQLKLQDLSDGPVTKEKLEIIVATTSMLTESSYPLASREQLSDLLTMALTITDESFVQLSEKRMASYLQQAVAFLALSSHVSEIESRFERFRPQIQSWYLDSSQTTRGRHSTTSLVNDDVWGAQ